ncbi:hypothetical protein [Inhella sp.]|uniref:hypothetical protein n=1 Tax=Inhella sp. TaxID=1921806 RepID=UPI0035AFF162
MRSRLLPVLRRLGLGLLLTLLVASAGASDWRSALATVGGLAALLVMPLVVAEQGSDVLRWCLLALLASTAWLATLQAWLLPRAWLPMERQLPLTLRQTLRSDLQVCTIALLPWLGFGLLGLISVSLSADARLARRALPSAGLLLLLAVFAVGLGGSLMQWRRLGIVSRARRLMLYGLGRRRAPACNAWRGMPLTWPAALLLLPLLRGAWPRSATALATYATLLLLIPLLASHWPAGALWLLLVTVPSCLLAISHVATLLRAEGEVQAPALSALPLQLGTWRSARQALALLPAALGTLGWGLTPLAWRAWPSLSALCLLIIGGAWLAARPLRRDEEAAVRLLLLLLIGLALTSQSLA